jgi:hypothetical protein
LLRICSQNDCDELLGIFSRKRPYNPRLQPDGMETELIVLIDSKDTKIVKQMSAYLHVQFRERFGESANFKLYIIIHNELENYLEREREFDFLLEGI